MRKIIASAIFLTSITSQGAKFPCPKEIKTKQSLVGVKKNWQTLIDPQGEVLLKSVEFYSGHPKKMALLAPDNKDTDQDPFWTFVPKDEIWQVCTYQNTTVHLIKKIGKNFKRCEVRYNKTLQPAVDSVECN